MSGTAIGKHMNLGYAGRISRDGDVLIENRIVKTGTPDIEFGMPVVLNSDNTYQFFGAAGTAATFAGIAVAEAKQATTYFSNTVAYKALQPCDVLARGTATIICGRGTPTAGGKVYVRTALNGTYPTAKIGDFEATADSTNSVEITNARWTTGYIDANNVAEVTLITRVNP